VLIPFEAKARKREHGQERSTSTERFTVLQLLIERERPKELSWAEKTNAKFVGEAPWACSTGSIFFFFCLIIDIVVTRKKEKNIWYDRGYAFCIH
jgi:ABC-type multidrug transport system permease subunit